MVTAMNSRAIEIKSKRNKKIIIKAFPGHFATSHSHVNYYIDMTVIKSQQKMAKLAAEELAKSYYATEVDTIVCLDGTRIIGAFFAEQLSQSGVGSINQQADICIITPEINLNNQMIFRDNAQPMVWNKKVLLLVASVTTGKTINRAMECIQYYGGETIGICALFSVVNKVNEIPINTIFSSDDVTDYQTYSYHDCPFCKENRKIDAMVNGYGYSKV